MPTLKVTAFQGELPKISPRLLPDMAAQYASNVRLDDGSLTPVRKSREITTLGVGFDPETIYYDKVEDEWLSFASFSNVAPGPVDDARLYITGDGAPKLRISSTDYALAFDGPSGALTATTGGTATASDETTRIYVYTYVTDFGEESEPCPVSNEVIVKPGQTVTLSGFSVTTSAGRTVAKQRIYRSQNTLAGVQLFLIAERTAGTGNFVDNISIEKVAEPLPSLEFNAPPAGLEGIVSMPNGMMAAFVDKQVYFCEPWQPHAWPEKYILTMDYSVKGLGVFANTLVVVTDGFPYLITGNHPDSMIQERLELNYPCINKKSVVDLGFSVVYASHEGLVQISPNNSGLITRNLFSRTDWQTINPESLVCGQYRGRYYASYAYTDGIEYRGTFIIDISGEEATLRRADFMADAFHYRIDTGSLYYLIGKTIYEYDAEGEVNDLVSWKSKPFVMPNPTSFGAILIEGDTGLTPAQIAAIQASIDAAEAENAALILSGELDGDIGGAAIADFSVAGDLLVDVPTFSADITVNIYADGDLVDSISTYNDAERITSGYMARIWEIEVVSNITVLQITMAGTMHELRDII